MNELIYVRNYKQACAYISKGVKPVDIKYEDKKLVFVFDKQDTSEVWEQWKNYKIEI